VLGVRHPNTLSEMGPLADMLREQGKLSEAWAVLGGTPAVADEVRGEGRAGNESTLVLRAK
jgi:hypothetical protein